MANPTWTVSVRSIASDGTNLFLEVEISNGTTTFPLIRPIFPAATTAATIVTYLQNIANAKPTLGSTIAALQNTTYSAGS